MPGQSLRVKPGDLYNLLQYPRLRMASASRLVSRLGDELDAAMASLAAGTPMPLGLVSTASLFESHQVVAVGYDDSVASGIRIFLYDCRNPDQTATLTVAAQGPSCTLDVDGQASETWRAFFVERYSTRPPTYTDLALAAPVVVTDLADGTAALRFTVRNSGDATAHATAVGVRPATGEPAGEHGGRPADAAGPKQPLGDLAPATQFAYDQSVPAGSSFGEAFYTDATGHEYVLPSNG